MGETLAGSCRPLTAIEARGGQIPWIDIDRLIKDWRPARVIVGLPRHLDGRESPLGTEARAFAEELGHRHGRPVELWDEALSTEAARNELAHRRSAGGRRTDRRRLNAEAAREILCGWISEHPHG